MINFIRRKFLGANYSILARYKTGDWLRSFTIKARSASEACYTFDKSCDASHWERVSGATIATES